MQSGEETANYRGHNLLGYCTEHDAIYKELKSGMRCQKDFQCLSKFCDSGLCKGGYAGDPCRSNEDCAGNYYCMSYYSNELEWNQCTPTKTSGEGCSNDYEC